MKKRTFTKEQKLSIIQEAGEKGVKLTLAKYGIYPVSYYDWKKKLSTMGEEGLNYGMTPVQQKRIRELEKENKMLRELLAEKELEGRYKTESINKKYALKKKRNS